MPGDYRRVTFRNILFAKMVDYWLGMDESHTVASLATAWEIPKARVVAWIKGSERRQPPYKYLVIMAELCGGYLALYFDRAVLAGKDRRPLITVYLTTLDRL